MKIIIVGFGKVGTALARQLSLENHDITVVDIDPELAGVADSLDVAFCEGNGVNAEVLRDAGCQSAHLVIAVTGVDEINMLVCRIVKSMNDKVETIARIRNPEYSSQIDSIRVSLGIDMSINPELAATSEISRLLRFPSAMTVDSFANSKVEIVSIRMKEDSILDGVPLYELQKKVQAKALICAVERNGEIHIPTGDFILKAEDRISVVAKQEEIEKFFRSTGTFSKRKIKKVMIIGASKIAFYLTADIALQGMDVTVIESNKNVSDALAAFAPANVRVVHEDGSDSEVLQQYNITSHDAFIALTGLDEENMVLAMYAARQGLGKVIAKVNRQTFLGMVKNTDVETYVSPKLICANQILQYVRAKQNSQGSNVETLHTIVDDKVEALEFKVRAGARCIGIPLRDLKLKRNMLVACITRGRNVITPAGNDVIKEDDRVIIVTTEKGLNDLDDILR